MTTLNDRARRSPIAHAPTRAPTWRVIRNASASLLLATLLSPAVQAQTPVLMSVSNASRFESQSGEVVLVLPVNFAGGSNPSTVTGTVSATPLSGSGFNPATGAASCGAAGVDFESFTNVPFEIPPNTPNGSLSVNIAICGDATIEPDEHIFVSITNVSGGAFCTAESCAKIGTIVNDDGPPSITIGDLSVSEPVTGGKVASVPVKLHHATSSAVSVNFATRDGTAKASTASIPRDYTATSGTLTIPAGSLQGTISVSVRGDGIRESSENFFVDLASPANATILDGTGRVTILDTTLSVGGFQLAPDTADVESGDTVAFDLTWTMPDGQSWHTLDWIDFRIGHGKSALLVMWDEETNQFSLCEISGEDANEGARTRRGPPAQCGPGALPGSPTVLYTPAAQLRLVDTTVAGSGPNVTLRLVVSFGPEIFPHDYAIEVAAGDDSGGIDAFTRAGEVQVE